MKNRLLWIMLAAVAVFVALVWLLITSGGPPPAEQDPQMIGEIPTPTPAPQQRIILLFPANDGLLHPELRIVPLPVEVDERVRVVMLELLAGPQENLFPVFPYPAELASVFIDGTDNAFIDLTPPPEALAGSHTEILLAYGVVNSVMLNCPELKGVQLLFGGTEVSTLTGHLDLSRPLTLNKRLIVAS